MKRTLLSILIASASLGTAFSQQDPLYTQYMFNMLAINPAYTGINNNLNITVNSRWQWTGLEGSPKTNILTANSSFLENKVGLGALILRDELGVSENTEGYLSYAYKIQSSTSTISFGLQTGFINYQYNFGDLDLNPATLDPNFSANIKGDTRVNFGAGLIYMTDNLFLGLSVPRILNTEFTDGVIASTRYQRHYYLTGAYLIELQRGIKVKPMVLLKGVDGAPLSVDLSGSVLLNNKIWAGVFTRNLDTYGLMGQVELSDGIKVGYAFEITTGDFIPSALTTHEFMATIDLALFGAHTVFQRHF